MFLVEFEKDSYPFNMLINVDHIKKIEYKNTKFVKGWQDEDTSKYEGEVYQVKITFKDNTEEFLMYYEEGDIKYFFEQLTKLGLKQ